MMIIMHVCIRTHVRTYARVSVRMRLHVNMHACMHASMYVCACFRKGVYVKDLMYIDVRAFIVVCVYGNENLRLHV